MCLTMKKWQQINTGLAQNIYFFFLSLLVFRKNLNNSNWKTKKNLFWNSKIIVVRYFRTMYLYQHFKNRAVSITSDFPPHIIALIAPSQLPLNWNFLFHYFATVLTLYKLEVTSIYMLRKWLDCWTQGLLIARQILVFSAFNKTQHLPELWQDYSVVNRWVYSAGSQSKLQNKKINK